MEIINEIESTCSTDQDLDPDLDPPVRKMPKRGAKSTATSKLASKAKLEIEITPKHINQKDEPSASTRTRRLPGSQEQLKKKASDRAEHSGSSPEMSLYLQRRCMKSGTLPDDWKRVGFTVTRVSNC